jgi:hypothetical protein
VEMGQKVDPVALSWRLRERPAEGDRPGRTVVELYGEIDENADFSELRRRLAGAVTFHLADVRRINSVGVREWVNFVRELVSPASGGRVTDLTFSHCSPAIVTQLNMIYNFRGQARVRSFLAPYACTACDAEEEQLLDVALHFAGPGPMKGKKPPSFPCERCGGAMELDDLPERYLSFLSDT